MEHKQKRDYLFPLYILFINSFLIQSICAQTSSQNMYLLANLNHHPEGGLYSALWGYSAPNNREYAMLGCWTGTSFVDITDSSNIHESYFLPGLGAYAREMKTFSHYAYILGDGVPSGLQIVDLQYLPDSVHLVNTFFFSGFTRGHTIQVEGPYLYINSGDYSNQGLFVLDLTADPVHPVKRGEWEFQVVHDCRVINDTIWACNIYNPPGTISVIDARNKDSLRTIAQWVNVPQPGPHNIAISADRKYAFVGDEIAGNPRLLKIWDIRDLNNVIKVAEWQPTNITTSIIHNVELLGNYLFAAHYTAGVRVINVTDPTHPTEAGWYDTYQPNNGFTYDGCWAVYVFPGSKKIIASDRETGLYVLKTTFPIVTGNNSENVPSDFVLQQNYPNPFNPSTTIKYSVKEDSYITLKIYDASGRLTSLLVDGFTARGNKSFIYDSKNLASGIYFCNLTAQSSSGKRIFTQSRKMVLVK